MAHKPTTPGRPYQRGQAGEFRLPAEALAQLEQGEREAIERDAEWARLQEDTEVCPFAPSDATPVVQAVIPVALVRAWLRLNMPDDQADAIVQAMLHWAKGQ